ARSSSAPATSRSTPRWRPSPHPAPRSGPAWPVSRTSPPHRWTCGRRRYRRRWRPAAWSLRDVRDRKLAQAICGDVAAVVVGVGGAFSPGVRHRGHALEHRSQQVLLLVDQVGPVVVGHLIVVGHRQRASRAGLDAQPASDTAQVIDLIDAAVAFARRKAGFVGVVGAFDVDRVGWTRPRAQFAPDAFLQAVGVTVELMAAVVAGHHRPRVLRIALGDRALEHRAERDAESGEGTEELSHWLPPLSPAPAAYRATLAWGTPARRTLCVRTVPPTPCDDVSCEADCC